jgi:hypothetical protein
VDQESLNKLNAAVERLRKVIQTANNDIADIEAYILLSQKPSIAAHIGMGRLTHLSADVSAVAETIAKTAGRFPSQKERILTASEQVLSDGVRRLSRELLPEIEALGVTVGGKDPVTNLAGYLSREKHRFQSDQKAGGWTLTRLAQKAKPGNGDTLPGFFSNSAATHA